MKDQILNLIRMWQREYFHLFIYIYASLADNEIIYTEWDMMKEKINISGADMDYSVAFVDVTKVFQRCNDSEVLEVLDYFKTNFTPTPEEINTILANAEEIIASDSEVRAEEKQIIHIIHKALS
jgi:hypothetical protein